MDQLDEKLETLRMGLAFDDITLVPGESEVLPKDVDVRSRLTRAIPVNIPILSAAMDTVTESRLAIALAREGGIGIIHRNMPIEEQGAQVDQVKRSESGMITKPITLTPDAKVGDALALMGRYKISGVPITVDGGRLVGIVTNRDLRFETDLKRPVAELMTRGELVTAAVGTTLEEAKTVLHQHRIEKLLVVDEDFHLQGLITIKDIEKLEKFPHACKDEHGRLRTGAAFGVGDEMEERLACLLEHGADCIVLDSSHAHSHRVIRALERARELHPGAQIIVGNVATYEGARDLMSAGADAVKVGVGPGGICTTRVVTGAGVPQITAITDAVRASDEFGIPIIADGGIRFSGDITKAIAAGAHMVMVGGLLAGTEEAPGETVLFEGRSYKEYRGMASLAAMRAGSKDRYFQEHVETDAKLVPEGIEGRVPYKGPLSHLVYQLVGGLRSGMGLCGCRDIEELRTKAQIMRITPAGLREAHVHDVAISKEAPNYQREPI